MSDLSDDTNHLLLIPPDFFMADLANVSATTTSDDVGSSVSKHAAFQRLGHHPDTPQQQRNNTADSSFRSYCPMNNGTGRPSMFHHSTPKITPQAECKSRTTAAATTNRSADDHHVIGEIDRFLSESRQPPRAKLSPEETLREFRAKCSAESNDSAAPLGRSLFRAPTAANGDEPLLSLSAMWGLDERRADATLSLHEERMRRAHCEQTIQQLQRTLLDREQKLAIALRVDRRKDAALASLKDAAEAGHAERVALQQSLDRAVQRFADEHLLIDGKCAQLQHDNEQLRREASQSQVAQRHLHECNELLEQKIAHVSRSTTDVRAMHQQQIGELEVRLKNCARNEELLDGEVTALRAENATLSADLARVKGEAEQSCEQWQSKEKTLLAELDTQRASLKTFYQAQLNEAVARKLADFQLQLDGVEATLRAEARQRERLIAERAMRQMELIMQKNEQECALLSEKYSAEIELYRIQLQNASKTIDALTHKVDAFHEKRTDMAERLHTVMETQWQRALEILASPTGGRPKVCAVRDDHQPTGSSSVAANVSGESQRTRAESESCSTPITVRQRHREDAQGMEAVVAGDPLQHYIDMLLEKSPRDADHFKDILGANQSRVAAEYAETERHRSSQSGPAGSVWPKKPWK